MPSPNVIHLVAESLLKDWIEDAIVGDQDEGNACYKLPDARTPAELAKAIWFVSPVAVTWALGNFFGQVSERWKVSVDEVLYYLNMPEERTVEFLRTLVLTGCGYGVTIEDQFAAELERARTHFFQVPGKGLSPDPVSVDQFVTFITDLVDPYLVNCGEAHAQREAQTPAYETGYDSQGDVPQVGGNSQSESPADDVPSYADYTDDTHERLAERIERRQDAAERNRFSENLGRMIQTRQHFAGGETGRFQSSQPNPSEVPRRDGYWNQGQPPGAP